MCAVLTASSTPNYTSPVICGKWLLEPLLGCKLDAGQLDAIGRFRAQEAGNPVDASSTLPDGIQINGPAELRKAIQQHHAEEFIRNVTQRLTAVAPGRALKPQDEGLIRRLIADLKMNDHRADALIKFIVLIEAFWTQGQTH